MTPETFPRVQLEQMPSDLARYLQPRVERLGYLGEMFQVSAVSPDVLMAFMRFTDTLKEAVPLAIGEVAVLTVATLMKNDYERNQHERLCLRSGLSKEWVRDVESMSPGRSTLLAPAEVATQQLVMAIVESRGLEARQAFENACTVLTAAQVCNLVFLAGRYVTHALMVNVMELRPPVPSVFADGFAA